MNHQNEAYLAFKDQDTFTGYESLVETTTVLKAFDEGVVLKRTPFYAESGGQVADKGVLRTQSEEYTVEDVQKLPGGQFLHIIADHHLKDGDSVVAEVDETTRKLTMYNHSATHLLFAALRDVVGDHVSQQGSNVSSEGMRFDFNNYDALDDDTLLEVERIVNEKIQADIPVDVSHHSVDEARDMGAVAEFGEKYGTEVRVVNMGYTLDLCGGTHVPRTGVIEKFAIASIESKGSGIYRITGHANDSIENIRKQFVGIHQEMDKLVEKAERIVADAKDKGIDLSFSFQRNNRIQGSYQDIIDKRNEFARLGERVKDLDKEYQQRVKDQAMSQLDTYLAQADGIHLVIKTDGIDKNSLRPLADKLMDHLPGGFVFIANVDGDKVSFVAKSQCDLHAGNIAKMAAQITGGGGGGRPDMAQAGGRDVAKVDEALAAVRAQIR